MDEEKLTVFYGMTESKAKETLKNAVLTKMLAKTAEEYYKLRANDLVPPKKISNLIYLLSSKIKPATDRFIPFLIQYVLEEKIDSELRLTAALKYLLEHIKNPEINTKEFDNACGVGISVTDEDIERVVKETIDHFKADLIEKRYRLNVGLLMGHIRNYPNMEWADGSRVKSEVEQQIRVMLGPKTEEDLNVLPSRDNKNTANKAPQSKQSSAGKKADPKSGNKTLSNDIIENGALDSISAHDRIMIILRKLPFHKPGLNYTAEGYPSSPLAFTLLEKHLKETKGQVRTRFPPEPNGILHIGHAKAINIDFGYAKAHDGVCFLRYDDTNPEKEEERFFRSILEMVEWLGYKPYKVTHSSDNFQQLYDWAVVLIKNRLAYVCHQPAEELKGYNPPPSPWRNRPIEENLIEFKGMKEGKYEEGAASLRMKITLEEGKVDPVAYRIRYVAHHRTGDKWCIYPTYDFTHCLCDSIENITHSLCTKEFQNRRSSYYWLCEAVGTYIPVQWEYGRLNMCYTVVSKRKIAKLISENIVKDWDDPRLFTLPALRRKGFPPEAINDFCVRMGVTGATIMVEPAMLEACVRDVLNTTAPRTMAVVGKAIKITIENFPHGDRISKLDVPDFPAVEGSKIHQVSFGKCIYIEQEDFREKADKGYKRFACDQPVGLRYAGIVLTCKKVIKDASGSIVELIVTSEDVANSPKPKGFIHWVCDPISIDVRLYQLLFKHKNPEDSSEVPGGFLSDCNRDSLVIAKGLADKHLLSNTKPFTQFQFERTGYFSVDPDSSSNLLVFNRTVTLKEDTGKN